MRRRWEREQRSVKGLGPFWFRKALFIMCVLYDAMKNEKGPMTYRDILKKSSRYGIGLDIRHGRDIWDFMKRLVYCKLAIVVMTRPKRWRYNNRLPADLTAIVGKHMNGCRDKMRSGELCPCVYKFMNMTRNNFEGTMYFLTDDNPSTKSSSYSNQYNSKSSSKSSIAKNAMQVEKDIAEDMGGIHVGGTDKTDVIFEDRRCEIKHEEEPLTLPDIEYYVNDKDTTVFVTKDGYTKPARDEAPKKFPHIVMIQYTELKGGGKQYHTVYPGNDVAFHGRLMKHLLDS